ncbi:uncharacterized protein LODBEIA_P36490 [Lodderomyces beijingensis]|uniref:Maintenance of telomere capping protein 1 n=1 Tax=Lodderomyces beijingensis TaxID=1775926 RepID=A0ABP0ZQE9_9ASCO
MSKSEDVLDFLNSLPEVESKSTAADGTQTKNAKDENLFDFLDEIAQHEQQKPKKKLVPRSASAKPEESSASVSSASVATVTPASARPAKTTPPPSQQQQQPQAGDDSTDPTTGTSSSTTSEVEEKIGHVLHVAEEELGALESELSNPLASISSWWNREGGQRVSSLWGAITSNAEKLGEQTYQLASQTTNQINERSRSLDGEQLSHRLNSMFINISNQIKQGLIDDVDEVLNVLVVSDLYGFQYLPSVVEDNFQSVMEQVQGKIRVSVNEYNRHHENEARGDKVEMNMFYGKLIDGEKLALANLESAIKEYKKVEIEQENEQEKGNGKGKEHENEKENEDKLEKEHQNGNGDGSDEMLKSNIFISIQPISTGKLNEPSEPTLQSGPATTVIDTANADSFTFTVILHDITNEISITTRTQPFPLRWGLWLDGEPLVATDANAQVDDESVDPKEWVRDWIRQGIHLGLGVLAQEYVIKRMGI